MGLIVITVQDTENGAVVSLAAEPAMNMAAPPAGEAQKLAHVMLGALPMNGPREEGHASDCAVHNEPAEPAGPCDCGATPVPAAAGAEVQFPM